MDVAKRLDFDPTETLTGNAVAEAATAGQRCPQSANAAALADLQKAVQELAAAAKQKQAHMLALAKQSAEQGVGDNDLKRLKRQFDSNKATFVNIDQKQRFMQGLLDLPLDIEQLTAVKDQQEAALATEADALRALKAQNEQARGKLAATSSSIAQLYSLVAQATAATSAQLDATAAVLQQQAASRPAAAHEPLPPGPDEAEAAQQVDAETSEARDLERSIAEAEAQLAELDAQAGTDSLQLAELRAEVDQLEMLASDRAKAADTDAHAREAAQWAEGMLQFMSRQSGLSILDASSEQLLLGISVTVPTALPAAGDTAAVACRQVRHELCLQLWQRQGSSTPAAASAAGVQRLCGAKLSPSCVDVCDLVDEAPTGLDGMAFVVREVRGRLLRHWQRQALVEAAAEVFPPGSSSRGPPHVKALLPQQGEVEVLVPLGWPSGPERLRVVHLACPELPPGAAAELMEAVNSEDGLLAGADLLALLRHVAAALEARLLDAAMTS